MKQPAGEGWLPVVLSVAVHALLVAVLGWGVWNFKRPLPAPRQLAIEATVIQETSAAANPAPESGAPAPPPAPVDNTAELERQAREQAAAEAQKAHDAELERQAEEARRDEARREDAKRAEVQNQAQAKAKAREEAQEKAQEKAREKARHDAEQKRVVEQKRQADEAARKAHDAEARAAQERTRLESDLRAQLANEERINAARGSADAAAYRSMIQARIERAWIRPGSQRGVNCEVHVTQVPGGEVTGVQITRCNGDAALRESIEAAVYRASPLPVPTNPDLFDRNLVLTFHPDD
jgi:colicin import membrane protein